LGNEPLPPLRLSKTFLFFNIFLFKFALRACLHPRLSQTFVYPPPLIPIPKNHPDIGDDTNDVDIPTDSGRMQTTYSFLIYLYRALYSLVFTTLNCEQREISTALLNIDRHT